MKTVISTDRAAAVELLRKGDVVALPTETVYGLAANALNPIAVAKIFEAKERPHFDPLIVHLPNREWLEKIVDVPAADRQVIGKLTDKFWPGPFTVVLPKRDIIPDIVTAGLDTVAVRLSAQPVFAEIVGKLNEPLAVPSANRFGRVSPTTAHHVLDELDGRIRLIVDAGATEHGIESTIVSVQEGKIAILRRGPITDEQLAEFADIVSVHVTQRVSAPGQLPSHYRPATPLCLIDRAEDFLKPKDQRVGLLAWKSSGNSAADTERFAAFRNLSQRGDLREAAANLFRYLRELDVLGLDLIVAERVPSQGLGAAIMDRLQRASHR
ncbi:MAG TPA: L-threonylcarbamoyladenylate synthase [Candidatus Udaeobacter sp.]|nr:L-threonylcarbamoyladenylate synthase [Candidatus Udaeobacter sp.]